jgi:alpha-L-rhamnosidase
MNSFNHYSFGSVGEWMFRFMAGIETDDAHPGYAHFLLQPNPGPGIDWVSCSYDSIKGTIAANWKRRADGKVDYAFEVPANTTATLTLRKATEDDPATPAGAVKTGSDGKEARFELAPGRYDFTA